MTLENYATWLEIDLSILRKNLQILRKITGKKIMAVVKANAYGHGLERVAKELDLIGVDWLGVARIEEGLLLREHGIKANILVLGYTAPFRIPHAIKNNISLTVYDFSVAQEYALKAAEIKANLKLHAKIDTGMGRLGVKFQDAIQFIETIQSSKLLHLEGIFTHFAVADEPHKKTTQQQLDTFQLILDDLHSRTIDFSRLIIHTANSAGALNFENAQYDMLRIGIALYGEHPSPETPLPEGILPALSWKTKLISIKEYEKGHGISYGHIYHTKHDGERIGVIAVGYGDGFRRINGNSVLIQGKWARIVGRVCMDQCMVLLDDIPEAAIGDEVVIAGEQGSEKITVSEIAEYWGTINYEVLCGLASRLPRYYLNSKI